jgi:hypothetical protein
LKNVMQEHEKRHSNKERRGQSYPSQFK